jgi:uncharacterized PurR-regulated membrane protein YhhQ (DUF165 family)
MTLELALTLLGLLLMIVGSIFYIIAMLMKDIVKENFGN